MQSKKHSLLETCLSTFIGFVVALLTQIIVFPWFNMQVTLFDNVLISLIFTIVSIIRGYSVRRLFNYLHANEIL